MSLRKISFFILIFVLVLSACEEDDGFNVPEPLDLEEKQKTDDEDIISYLNTHYYNSAKFSSDNTNLNDIEITEIALGGNVPVGNTLLMGAVEIDSFEIGGIDYPYYILNINQGLGINSPKFSDNVLIAYEGFRVVDDFVFDSRLNPNPSVLDLTNTIEGWKLIIPEFNTANESMDNGDGTISYNNSGLGMMFIPSALGYLFTNNDLQLQPLVFKFEVIKSFQNDPDNDGIPSYLEELTGDQSFSVFADTKDDDTDEDGTPDYFDNDDDNDGKPTIDEIEITTIERATAKDVRNESLNLNQKLLNEITKKEENGTITFIGTIITFPDTDGDTIPDYLDAE